MYCIVNSDIRNLGETIHLGAYLLINKISNFKLLLYQMFK